MWGQRAFKILFDFGAFEIPESDRKVKGVHG